MMYGREGTNVVYAKSINTREQNTSRILVQAQCLILKLAL